MTRHCELMLQSTAATCSLIEQLTKLGHITSTRCPQDRRKWRITAVTP